MSTYTPIFTSKSDDRFLTVAEVARYLHVDKSTIRRWIAKGKLPAYRVGDKGVRLLSRDVASMLTPLPSTQEKGGRMAQTEQQPVRRLTPVEQERARETVARMQQLRSQVLAERGGTLFPDSAELINQARTERTEELLRHSNE